MDSHAVVSHEQWIEARRQLLRKEKEFTRLRDLLSQQRRELPWEAVDKPYVFEDAVGQHSLAALFGERSQLIVQHFMFDPGWEAGCKSCSFWADNFNGTDVHLRHRDISFVVVSRAPYPKLAAYRQRMGWAFRWVSSAGSDFNYDFYASFTPDQIAGETAFHNYREGKPWGEEVAGVSVFFKDAQGRIFHTYSTYARGLDMLNGAYHYIDLTPRGRHETASQSWVQRHDEYGD